MKTILQKELALYACLAATVVVLIGDKFPGRALAASEPPPGFVALFNGRDLSGWRGGDTFDHRKWLAMPEAERTAKNAEWTADMRKHWRVENGELINDAWLAIYARPARTEEVASAQTFLERQTAEMGSKKAASAELVRVLFNTNEFLYVD